VDQKKKGGKKARRGHFYTVQKTRDANKMALPLSRMTVGEDQGSLSEPGRSARMAEDKLFRYAKSKIRGRVNIRKAEGTGGVSQLQGSSSWERQGDKARRQKNSRKRFPK